MDAPHNNARVARAKDLSFDQVVLGSSTEHSRDVKNSTAIKLL
jgi:hypothetical protein